MRTEFALATTEGADPRSSNQSLTGENSRKSIMLDLAWAEWAPTANWKIIGGKMRYPLIRPGQSIFIDGDINPDGLAATWTRGDLFAGALYDMLEERGAAPESTQFASQIAWRPKLGKGKLSVGAGYQAFSHVKGFNPFHANASNGNTTTSVVGACVSAPPCLANNFDVVQLFAEWSQSLAGRPLALFVDFARNQAANNGLDTALAAGFTWGKASDPRTWELGVAWQRVDKDALFGQLFNSDFGSGLTDSHGSILCLGYAPARNWVVNATYFVNDTNVDVPVTVANVGAVSKRNYRRLQLDLNFKY